MLEGRVIKGEKSFRTNATVVKVHTYSLEMAHNHIVDMLILPTDGSGRKLTVTNELEFERAVSGFRAPVQVRINYNSIDERDNFFNFSLCAENMNAVEGIANRIFVESESHNEITLHLN